MTDCNEAIRLEENLATGLGDECTGSIVFPAVGAMPPQTLSPSETASPVCFAPTSCGMGPGNGSTTMRHKTIPSTLPCLVFVRSRPGRLSECGPGPVPGCRPARDCHWSR